MSRTPSFQMPIATSDGMVTQQWARFFSGLATENGGKVVVPTVGASPFAYIASAAGHVLIAGGTVSAVSLTRGRSVIATGMTGGFVPTSAGDTVTVTYTVAPTMTFIPT